MQKAHRKIAANTAKNSLFKEEISHVEFNYCIA